MRGVGNFVGIQALVLARQQAVEFQQNVIIVLK